MSSWNSSTITMIDFLNIENFGEINSELEIAWNVGQGTLQYVFFVNWQTLSWKHLISAFSMSLWYCGLSVSNK